MNILAAAVTTANPPPHFNNILYPLIEFDLCVLWSVKAINFDVLFFALRLCLRLGTYSNDLRGKNELKSVRRCNSSTEQ